ncbi:MAG: ABC transporter ATP-binding protein [bacterium]|nr:ABC transporter ATP-binding protein [bacterium]
MEKPILEAQNISKVYDVDGTKTTALRCASLKIYPGEFVAIMGPSGSGKSTLLHIMGLLDRPTDGKYTFEGKSINEYSDDELAHIRNERLGFVFQMFNLLPRASVLENIKLPLLYSHVPENERMTLAQKAAEAVGLKERIDHTASQLSGGERQRVAIARALVNNPSIIFADEPTGNLDSKSGGQIMDIINKLNEKGHTIVLVTHETYTAHYAQRLIRLYDGKIEDDIKVDKRNVDHEFMK